MFKSKLKFSLLAGIISVIIMLSAGAFADSGQGIPSNIPQPYPWSSSASNFMYNEFVANPNMCIVSCVESGKTDVYYFDKTWQSGYVALPTTDTQALSATWDLTNGLQQFDALDDSYLYTYIPSSNAWSSNGTLQSLSLNQLDASGNNPWTEDSNIIQIYRAQGHYIIALINNQDGNGDEVYLTHNESSGSEWTNWANTKCITGDIGYFSSSLPAYSSIPNITVYDYDGNSFATFNASSYTWSYSVDTTINYVSPILNDSSNAVYRITIPTERICTWQLAGGVQDSGNALTYKISFSNGTACLEYPLSGFLFDGNYYSLTETYSRPMSFEVVGPVSSSSSTYSTNKYDYDFSQSSPTIKTVSSTSATSIPSNDDTFTQHYPNDLNISVSSVSTYNYTNGTCAIPFLISLTCKNSLGNNVTLPADNYLYNHLVFYMNNGNADNIVGANPNNPFSGDCGVVSAQYAEAAPGYVKYGVSGSSLESYSNGRVYYLYCGQGAFNKLTLNIGLYNQGMSGDVYSPTAELALNTINPNIYPTSAAANQSSAIDVFTLSGFSLDSNSQGILYASDPYALNNNTNYLSADYFGGKESSPYDLILPDYTFDTYQGIYGIYAVSPYSGVSTDQLNNRYQWLNLADCSYRMQATNFDGNSNPNPLCKNNFAWQSAAYYTTVPDLGPQLFPITNFNSATNGKHLYDYLFSQYGTYYAYSYIDSNSLSGDISGGTYNQTNNSSQPTILTDPTVTAVGSQAYQSGIPYYYGLVLMPGKSVTYIMSNPSLGLNTKTVSDSPIWWTDSSLGLSKVI